MTARRGLRRRLWRDFLLQALYISVAAVVSVFVVGLLLEDVLIKQALRGEADYYWQQLEEDPAAALPDTRNLTVYRAGTVGGVPPWLRDLGTGFHRSEQPEESLAYVARQDGQTLYLVFDTGNVKDLVAFFGLIPLALVLVVIYLSLYRAYQISGRAVSPVVVLAQQVQRLDPSAPDAALFSDAHLPVDSDDEIRVLSSAMQGLTERLTEFAERERNFTRDASHELRSPLTVIKIGADVLLKNDALDPAARESVRRIKQAATDMEELTAAFLLLARESDQALGQDWVAVNTVVDGEVERTRLLAKDSSVAIEAHADSRLLVLAPEKVLASVVGNLLRNGLSYTDAGKVSVIITADRVTIEDTGPGMAPEEVEKVFQPFYRAQRRRGGHGVGLTIVKRLCDRFGWPVHIESSLGAGTQVIVRFPEARSEPLDSPRSLSA